MSRHLRAIGSNTSQERAIQNLHRRAQLHRRRFREDMASRCCLCGDFCTEGDAEAYAKGAREIPGVCPLCEADLPPAA